MGNLKLGFPSPGLTPAGWLAMGSMPVRHIRMPFDERREREMIRVAQWAADGIAHRSDQETYGKREHWAFPKAVRRILSPGWVLAGDCEDVALWIRRVLVATGWPRGALRLAFCQIPENHIVVIAQTDNGDYCIRRGGAGLWDREPGYRWRSLEAWPWWRMIMPAGETEIPVA